MPADAHTPHGLRTIDGPDWLVAQQRDAALRFESAPFPTTQLEEWRYSRIDRFDVSGYGLVTEAEAEGADPVDLGERSGEIRLHNGVVTSLWLDADLAAKGVVLSAFGDLADNPAVELAALAGGGDMFDELNAAYAPGAVLLSVPRNVAIEAPIVVLNHIDSDQALVLTRFVIDAGENSSVNVVEWTSSDEVDALVVPRTLITLAQAARVNHTSVNALSERTNQLGGIVATVGQEASVSLEHVALGGDFARGRFDCRLVGRGASGRISALYLGDRDQMHDLRTFQSHEARDTSSDLLFKGAVDGASHAVYTGLIRVGEQAAGTNANQTNRVITLSDTAWAESVPNLEINHNDVRCSHATAVGPIDEDQRFYLESRGVPPEAAERLVVNGFFAEVLEAVGNDHVVQLVAPLVAAKLEADS